MKIINIEVKNIEPVNVVAVNHTGDYSGITAAFGRIAEWATATDYWAKGPLMIGIYHDDPASVPVDKLRSTAALEDKGTSALAPGMERYTVSGGKYLVMTAEVTMAEYGEAWQKIYGEVHSRGLKEDARDHYEIYLSVVDQTQGDDSPWIVEFRVPVK